MDLIVLTPYVLALPKASIRGSTELGTQNPLASDITLWWGRWERGWVRLQALRHGPPNLPVRAGRPPVSSNHSMAR